MCLGQVLAAGVASGAGFWTLELPEGGGLAPPGLLCSGPTPLATLEQLARKLAAVLPLAAAEMATGAADGEEWVAKAGGEGGGAVGCLDDGCAAHGDGASAATDSHGPAPAEADPAALVRRGEPLSRPCLAALGGLSAVAARGWVTTGSAAQLALDAERELLGWYCRLLACEWLAADGEEPASSGGDSGAGDGICGGSEGGGGVGDGAAAPGAERATAVGEAEAVSLADRLDAAALGRLIAAGFDGAERPSARAVTAALKPAALERSLARAVHCWLRTAPRDGAEMLAALCVSALARCARVQRRPSACSPVGVSGGNSLPADWGSGLVAEVTVSSNSAAAAALMDGQPDTWWEADSLPPAATNPTTADADSATPAAAPFVHVRMWRPCTLSALGLVVCPGDAARGGVPTRVRVLVIGGAGAGDGTGAADLRDDGPRLLQQDREGGSGSGGAEVRWLVPPPQGEVSQIRLVLEALADGALNPPTSCRLRGIVLRAAMQLNDVAPAPVPRPSLVLATTAAGDGAQGPGAGFALVTLGALARAGVCYSSPATRALADCILLAARRPNSDLLRAVGRNLAATAECGALPLCPVLRGALAAAKEAAAATVAAEGAVLRLGEGHSTWARALCRLADCGERALLAGDEKVGVEGGSAALAEGAAGGREWLLEVKGLCHPIHFRALSESCLSSDLPASVSISCGLLLPSVFHPFATQSVRLKALPAEWRREYLDKCVTFAAAAVYAVG